MALRHLTDQDLKDIGVLLGHRRIMLAAIGELGTPQVPPQRSRSLKKPQSARRQSRLQQRLDQSPRRSKPP